MQSVNPLVSMLSETDYILFLKQIHRRHRSIDSLSGLSIYKKWLHKQGFKDWDDWKPFVRIVISESSRWDSLYLSENDWEIDEEWYELGYWGYWDSAIHYLDVWIDFNEPWDDFDEELEKLRYIKPKPPRPPKRLKGEDPEGTKPEPGQSPGSGEKPEVDPDLSPPNPPVEPSPETYSPPDRKPEDEDSFNPPEEVAEPSYGALRLPGRKPEASDFSEIYPAPEEELDFMTEEVKGASQLCNEQKYSGVLLSRVLGCGESSSYNPRNAAHGC